MTGALTPPLGTRPLGRYDEALTWAKMALREQPHSHAALRIAAASSALAGRDEEAKRLIVRLLEIDPALRISNFENVLGVRRLNRQGVGGESPLR